MNQTMSPQDCIFHLLTKASKAGVRCWKQQTADLGITAVQAKVLSFMHVYGDVTASRLGELTALDSATLTGLLDRLEAMDLARRQTKLDDRRAVLVCLTEHGRSVAETVHTRMQPANEKFLEGLSVAETAMLRELLKRL